MRRSISPRRSAGEQPPSPAAPGGALADVELIDGWVELELAVGPERAFRRVQERTTGTASRSSPSYLWWQPGRRSVHAGHERHIELAALLGGDGFWAPVASDRGVVSDPGRFAGAAPRFGSPTSPASPLHCPWKRPARAGGSACSSAGPTFTWASSPSARTWRSTRTAGRGSASWSAALVGGLGRVLRSRDRGLGEPRPVRGRRSRASRAGCSTSRVAQGIDGDRNTVLARTTIHAPRAEARALQLGFSDRALVYLNGVPIYRGDDTHRSRDYRFLGSIGCTIRSTSV